MRLTDGERTVDISMVIWNGSGYGPDWSMDFFEAGSLEYDEDKDAYVVDSVEYCIEQAKDCINHTGDFCDDETEPDDNEAVFVDEVEEEDV